MDNSKKISELLLKLQTIYEENLIAVGSSILNEIDQKVAFAKSEEEIGEILTQYSKDVFKMIIQHTSMIQVEYEAFLNDPQAMKEAALSLSSKLGFDTNKVLDALGLTIDENDVKLLELKTDDDDTTKH